MVEINQVDQTGWSRLLGDFGDASIYQTWEYAEIHWDYCRRDHFVLREDGRAASLAQVIILRLPFIRIAYIPHGPVWKRLDRPRDVGLFARTIRALIEEYVSKERLALRIRPNGFEGPDDDMKRVLADAGFSRKTAVQREGLRTILVDLSRSEADLRRQLKKKWRNNLSHSEKDAPTVRESYDPEMILALAPLYEKLKRRKNFEGSNLRELSLIQSQLGQARRMRIAVCENDSGVIAGSVCSGIGDAALGLLGVTSDEGRRTRAYYLLQWDEILWAKRTGHKSYDLNGINPTKNPTVYHFKSGLGGDEVIFLGLFDGYPDRKTERIVRVSDRIVSVAKKGKIIRFVKNLMKLSRPDRPMA
jgi:Acetyltransferase (GNAT) domain